MKLLQGNVTRVLRREGLEIAGWMMGAWRYRTEGFEIEYVKGGPFLPGEDMPAYVHTSYSWGESGSTGRSAELLAARQAAEEKANAVLLAAGFKTRVGLFGDIYVVATDADAAQVEKLLRPIEERRQAEEAARRSSLQAATV